MVILSALVLVCTFGAALGGVLAVRRRPILLAAPLALAALVVFEALLLDVLSPFGAVAAPGVFAGHLLALAAAAALAWVRGVRPAAAPAVLRRCVQAVRSMGWPGLLVGAVFLLLAVSAIRYLPSNWDSMTYHLARIAHWIQHRSVEPYPTHIDRQVVYQPGAEYVLAAAQVMAGSDRLANLLQLGAWILAVLASPVLARLAGAPRRIAPWAAVIVAALPMGVLQASSTQNDLVAGALALAIVAAALPFAHRAPRWRTSDAVLLGVAVGAGAIVKATVLVAAAPFVLVALVRAIRATPRRLGAVGVAVAVTAAVAAVPVVPETVRRLDPALAKQLAGHAAQYTYPAVSELPDRARNLLRGVVRHAPSPPALVEAAGIQQWCRPGETLCRGLLLRPHEDNAGNPLHVGLVLLAAAVAVARWRRLPVRAALFLGSAAGAWVLFHLVFRDNTWISRLETPTFVLTGLAVVAWAARPDAAAGRGGAKKRKPVKGPLAPFVATAIVATAALAFGANVALDNESRPPLPRDGRVAQLGYYANQPNTGRAHDAVLSAAAQLRCGRIGLFIGADTFDYPLTWRAMQRRLEVRHVFGVDPWPCLVFSDRRPDAAALAAHRWQATAIPFLFLNAGDRAN